MLPTISTGNVASALAGEYEVANSVRLNKSDTPYLNRTNGTATNNDKYTLSLWTKRGLVSSAFEFLIEGWTGNADTTCGILRFRSDDRLDFMGYNTVYRRTTRVFRDISAWYNIIVAVDTTQSTASDRIKMYINGVEETEFDTNNNPSQNANTGINNNSANLNLFRRYLGSVNDLHYGGYCTEYCLIDGQQLDQTSFGEFDSDSPNIWKPIDVTGLTFGTNGFYLDFENASSLGADVSGNSNNFTVNNLTSVDQTTDTCTNNFATLNPLEAEENSPTFSDGNLTQTTPNSGASGGRSTIEIPHTGVWYWEVKIVSTTGTIGDNLRLGISNDSPSSNSGQLIKYMSDGQSQIPGSSSSYGASYAAGDIIGIKVDADNNQVTFYKNGATQGAISYTMVDGETYKAVVGEFSNTIGCVYSMNFGNAPFSISSGNSDPNGYGNFEYSTDSGYALNTKNLAEFG